MNKSDLIDAIAVNANITKKDAGLALDGFMKAVEETLKKGDTVT